MTQESVHILIADDSASMRNLMATALQEKGHTVVCVNDGQQAVERFALQRFDLVFVDLVMPVLDGFVTTQTLKKMAKTMEKWVPVIVVTGLSNQECLQKVFASGADDFLGKPFHLDVLYAKVEAFTRSIRSYQKILESEARAQAIAEGVLDAVISIDTHCNILTVNSATERLFGYARSELIGKNINILMPEPYRHRHDGFVSDYLKTGIKKVIGWAGRDVAGMHKNGKTFPLRLGVSEIILNEERIFVGVLSDMTQIKNKEAKLQRAAAELQILHDEITLDMNMANSVMDKLILKTMLDQDPQIRYYLKPSVQFSGDLIAAMRSPSGHLYVMLADATGHGLAAAMSVLPALWVFYGMVPKDFTVAEIAAEINARLKKTVPIGRFVAAHIVSINNPAQTIRLWSGGMPSAWIINDIDGHVQEFPARHMALGILNDDEFDPQCEVIEWTDNSQLLMFSDGLIDAQYQGGDMLGDDKVTALISGQLGDDLLGQLLQLLDKHLNDTAAIDDISIANILLRRKI